MKYTDAYIKSDAFLDTFEWRKVRMEAILKHGKRCQCCGAVPLPSNDVKIHVDHIIPRKVDTSLALELSNLQVLCNVCNHGKGNWDRTDWREFEPPETNIEYSCDCKDKNKPETSNEHKPIASVQRYLSYDIKIPQEVRNSMRRFGPKYSLELGVIVTNLLFSLTEDACIAYSRDKGTRLNLRRNTNVLRINAAIDVLEEAGLLINFIGKGSKEKKFRQSSTILPTEEFKSVYAHLISDEKFMLNVKNYWQKAKNEVKAVASRPRRKVRIKKKIIPKNNLKVRKDVMKELLTVLTTWR